MSGTRKASVGLKSNWVEWVLVVVVLLGFFGLMWLDYDPLPADRSWKQISGDIEFRITEGRCAVVNPFSYQVTCLYADTKGIVRYFDKIPGGQVGNNIPVSRGWTCTVWAQGPIAFTTFRSPE